MKILMTGGAGFTGSNFIRHILGTHPDTSILSLLQVLEKPESLIEFLVDRPGHHRRNALNTAKIAGKLGWRPTTAGSPIWM